MVIAAAERRRLKIHAAAADGQRVKRRRRSV